MRFIIRALAMVIFCFIAFQTPCAALDVCILKPLTVTQVRGRVVTARTENIAEEPITGASVELSQISARHGWRIIAKVATDSNGYFAVTNIKPGSYSLAAKYHGLFTTAVEVKVRKAKKGEPAEEQIILGLGYFMPGCHGGYAELRQKRDK